MNEALAVLEPYLSGSSLEAAGRVVMGTVKGDLHDIGKNMVITMLRGVGFAVIDLGMDVHQEEFIRQVKEHDPEILGLSALLTTTMPEMKNVIVAFEQAGLRDKVKIMVGGATINEKFAKEIGADGYGADAGEAVALAKELLRK
jgi:5-methyltetrahydrofolate--homocysteine methyltransferase